MKYYRLSEDKQENAHNMKDKVLRRIKWYLAFTGQYWSFEDSANSSETNQNETNVESNRSETNRRKAKRILKQILYRVQQVIIFCSVTLYFVYTLGIFGSNKIPYILSYRFFHYPITTIDTLMWEFRWMITCLLGIWLSRRIWLEFFEKNMKDLDLGEDRWGNVKSFSRKLGVGLFMMWFATVLLGLFEIDFKVYHQQYKYVWISFGLDILFNLIDRILAFPLFFLCCVTMYILCCLVEEYCDDIEKWGKGDSPNLEQPKGTSSKTPEVVLENIEENIKDEQPKGTSSKTPEVVLENIEDEQPKDTSSKTPEVVLENIEENIEDKRKGGNAEGEHSMITQKHNKSKNCGENEARERFRKIKAAIRTAGLSFQIYLMVHFVLLLCTFFLGVISCFEQMKVQIVKGNENCTVQLFQIPRHTRFINFYGNLSLDTEYTITAPSIRSSSSMSASLVPASKSTLFTQTHGKDAETGKNITGENPNSDDIQTKWMEINLKIVAVALLIKTLESLLLYFLPISLMVRLQNGLRRVYEVIEDCNVEEQKDNGLLFDDINVIRRMCKYVKTGHGLKIFGYTVPTFQAYILAAIGPFLAVITQRLLAHIHMKK